jgi:uncharacterized lipoprotein YajG
MEFSRQLALAALAVFTAIMMSACASKPFLKVQYQLPTSSTVLTGETISLTISDLRKDTAFLSDNARKSIENFNDTYSLVVVRDDGSGNLIGAYDVDSLLREIFKQRLENEGGRVLATAENAKAGLAIQLKEFKLDIVDRKWTLRMGYQASLSRNKGIFAKESVSGSAERLKVMGKTDAEKILGGLVTDMVNRLDVAKLFEKTQ